MTRWTGRARNLALAVLGGILLVCALVLLLGAPFGDAGPGDRVGFLVTGGVLLAASVMVLAFVEVEVEVEDAGLRVRSRPFGRPRMLLPIAAIEEVRAVDHRAFSGWLPSGWGYRGSLRLFGFAAWVVRSGPAIELELTEGRRFTVTVDDAGVGAEALRQLVLAGGRR